MTPQCCQENKIDIIHLETAAVAPEDNDAHNIYVSVLALLYDDFDLNC